MIVILKILIILILLNILLVKKIFIKLKKKEKSYNSKILFKSKFNFVNSLINYTKVK